VYLSSSKVSLVDWCKKSGDNFGDFCAPFSYRFTCGLIEIDTLGAILAASIFLCKCDDD
jgi:hypothetical protein